ncbi:hypothetical protein [Helicobacter pylori]|uniref:hypothetical protein n=1 Tax=Helicobacter pylori TaxID=210 RepID=UPI001F2594F9|nr:hypothetical protein [Helicobacter pylori]
MGSWFHILVSILVVVLGLAVITGLWYRIMECIDEVRRGSWLTQILTGFGLWGWLTKGSASFFTSLLAKFGLGKHVCWSWSGISYSKPAGFSAAAVLQPVRDFGFLF